MSIPTKLTPLIAAGMPSATTAATCFTRAALACRAGGTYATAAIYPLRTSKRYRRLHAGLPHVGRRRKLKPSSPARCSTGAEQTGHGGCW
jgi:hypothetical protein